MKTVRVLFLGASKRVSLLERFIESAKKLGVTLEMFSCEISPDFYPISHLSTVLAGPKFADSEFLDWLEETITQEKIDIVIPTMDGATVALSKFADLHPKLAKHCWVSAYQLCLTMNDKLLADEFFQRQGWPVPKLHSDFFPKIAKPRLGFGAKGICRLENKEQQAQFMARPDAKDYQIQDFISAPETTIDLYVSPKFGLIGSVLRDRLEVSDGEVMACLTREPSKAEAKFISTIAAQPGWRGCVTIQYLRSSSGPLLLEINPRFGGGATAGIEAGLDMPTYLLAEHLGQSFNRPKRLKNLKMVRARRDFFQEQVK